MKSFIAKTKSRSKVTEGGEESWLGKGVESVSPLPLTFINFDNFHNFYEIIFMIF